MNIIKKGKTKEELERILKNTDDDEYEYEEDWIYSTYYCTCPNCERRAFEKRKELII